MTTMTRWLVLAVALLLVPGAGCGRDEEGGDAPAAAGGPGGPGGPGGFGGPTSVRVAQATDGEVERIERFTGDILADRQVQIAPLESGRLTSLLVDEGDVVEAGQRLGALDDELASRRVSELGSAVDEAEARLDLARAERDAQAAEVQRRQALVDRGAFERAELERLQETLAVREQNIALAQAQLANARQAERTADAELGRRGLVSPVAGRVVDRHVVEGAMVTPQTPVVTVIDEGSLELVARVSERRLADVEVGTQARVMLDASPDEALAARVTRIGGVVDPESRTVELRLGVDAGSIGLRHGMFARGELILDRTSEGVVVPIEALVRGDDGVAVFRVVDGVAHRMLVSPIIENERETALAELSPGDLVVLSPPRNLQDGGEVVTVGAPQASPPQSADAAPADSDAGGT